VLTNVKTKTFHFESPDAEVIEEIDEDPFEAVVNVLRELVEAERAVLVK
jgi:hypothetical protein